MTTNDEHNRFDDTFRQRIERLELPPLPINLDRVRADTLALQLAKATQQIRWLRGIAGLLLLLIGGLGIGYQHYNSAIPIASPPTKLATLTKLDTVYLTRYITRTEKVIVPVYAGAHWSKNDSNPDADILNTRNLTNPNSNLAQNLPQSPGNNTNTPTTDEGNSTGTALGKTAQRMVPEDENSPNAQPEASPNSQQAAVEPLTSRGIKGYFTPRTIPAIRYKPAALAASKSSAPPMTMAQRLSVSVYTGKERSSVDIRRDQIDAFSYNGNERISSTSVYGIRMGVKLTRKLRVSVGYEDIDYTFESLNSQKLKLKPELIDSQPTFVYRSIFGSAIVPSQELSKPPLLTDDIVLENEDNHVAGYNRIPVTFRYDFWNRPIHRKGRKITDLTLYGSAGGFYGTPSHQKLNVELYESNGRDFYTTLTNFRNTSPIWGWNLSAGVELRLAKKIDFWIEPSYHSSFTSMVSDLPLRTFPRSIGLRFGLQYHLSK